MDIVILDIWVVEFIFSWEGDSLVLLDLLG